MEEQQLPIKVSVVVPGIVESRIFADIVVANEAEEAHRQMLEGAMKSIGMPADEAAGRIFDKIAAEEFVISTHPRFSRILATERSEYLRDLSKPRASSTDFMGGPGD
jgi:hypothetical protein